MTYGDHQERACRDLQALITLEQAPDGDWTGARREALNTLAERMRHVGGPGATARPGRRTTLSSVVQEPVPTLMTLLGDMGGGFDVGTRPSDLLRSDAAGGSWSQHWSGVARELFLATADLVHAEDQPWTHRPSAGWHIVADAADAVEAIVAIDLRAAASRGTGGAVGRQLTERLLTAADVGRVARLLGTDDDAEGAEASTAGSHRTVALVRAAVDLRLAELRLATSLHPIGHDPVLNAPDSRPGLRCARVLAAGQADLNARLAARARDIGEVLLAESFESRGRRHRELHASTVRLVDVEPRRARFPSLQQAEITSQLRGLPSLQLDRAQLVRLDEACGNVARNLGQALRREGMQRGAIRTLRLREDGVSVPAAIASTRQPFHVACKALADEPQREAPRLSSTAQRTSLRRTLADVSYPSQRSPRTGATGRRLAP